MDHCPIMAQICADCACACALVMYCMPDGQGDGMIWNWDLAPVAAVAATKAAALRHQPRIGPNTILDSPATIRAQQPSSTAALPAAGG
jgi:hypothetical protein